MSDIREVPEEHEVIARDTSGDEEGFDDDEGYHPLPKSPYERELVTTPLDAPVRTLVQDIQDKTLIVNPPFQRGRVWTTPQKSRLIESLLLNIPIPVIFLADDEDGKRVGVDGQQRLRAIEEFVSGQYRLIKLEVLERMNNKRWTDLTPRESR